MAKDNSELIDVNSDVKDRVMEVSHIQSLIYVIRGKQVMLDSDLAILYQVETKTFNQAVKRNIERFPENFRFQLKKGRVRLFEVTICDLKRRERWKKISAICFYRTRYCNAFCGAEE
jgi:hypothetical protein